MLIKKLLYTLIVLGCLVASAALVASVMAEEYPALDIANNGLALLTAGLAILFLLSLAFRSRMLMVTTASLLAIALAVLVPNLSGAAPKAPEDSERFLRVTTLNVGGDGDLRVAEAEQFFEQTNADVLVLEEIGSKDEKLLLRLQRAYPHQAGKRGLVVLSRYPVVDWGWVNRPYQRCQLSPIAKWARIDVDGRNVDIVAVHMIRPSYPTLQKADFDSLSGFLASLTGPVVVAGDFNAAPWTHRFQGILDATGLKRLNTFAPTWPARWRNLPLLPVLPIDHILISGHLAQVDVSVGKRLGSDHLPVIADLALVD